MHNVSEVESVRVSGLWGCMSPDLALLFPHLNDTLYPRFIFHKLKNGVRPRRVRTGPTVASRTIM